MKFKWGVTTFYRGAKSLRSQKPSYWSTSPRDARTYARLRGGKVFKVVLTPKRTIVGSEDDVARQLGIYRRWVAERVKGHSGASLRRASALLHTEAEKAGYDVIVHYNQVVVLNPRIIHLRK